MPMLSPRLTLEMVVSEPVKKIKKIVVKWEGYSTDEEGEQFAWCKAYMVNFSRGSHRLMFKHWARFDRTLRFILTKSFGLYINDEGRMRFVIVGWGPWGLGDKPWLWTDFFEVTVCYED